MPEHLLPWQRLDLREPVLGVLGIHSENLLSAGRAQDFDDFNELVNAALTREDRLAQHQLSDDTADGPDIDVGAIVRVAEDELGGAVVARANIRYIGLALNELLGRAEVTQLQNMRSSVN